MNSSIEYLLIAFGYKNLEDFGSTVFLKNFVMKSILLLSIGMGTLEIFVEDFIGLKPIAYVSLVILFVLEFITGVTASIFVKKERFSSWKMGRIVLKIFVYSIILGLFNIFSHRVGGYSVFSFEFNFFEWTYFVVLNVLVLQLLVSVFENCEALGFKEVSVFLKIFRKKVKRIEEEIEDFDDIKGKKK